MLRFIFPLRNSLNNRFDVLDHVETEAVMSLDDDINTNHEQVERMFRLGYRTSELSETPSPGCGRRIVVA